MKIAKRVLVVGATSSLGVVLCRHLAQQGWSVVLMAKDEEEIAKLAADITIRYAVDVDCFVVDFLKKHQDFPVLLKKVGKLDAVFLLTALGQTGQNGSGNFENMIQVNITSPVLLLEACTDVFVKQNSGSVVIFASVAGDRGRTDNYLYALTKAALINFASGLRQRLFKNNIHVMTVKPGYIDTPVTYGIVQSKLIASREEVVKVVLKALSGRKDEIYVPYFWYFIMLIIRFLPEWLFKRLRFE